MEVLSKIFNYFCKKLYLRCSNGSWVRLCKLSILQLELELWRKLMREKKSGDVIDNDSNDEWVVVAMFHHDHYLKFLKIRNSHGRCSVKKEFLKISQNSQENTWARVLFLINLQASPATSLKETLAQVFSCELCKIFKNTYFIEHVRRRLLLENHLI